MKRHLRRAGSAIAVGAIAAVILAVPAVAGTRAPVVSPPPAEAMHIAEGFLPAGWCLVWFAACLPFWFVGLRAVTRVVEERGQEGRLLLALSGAFVFVLSSLKMPSVTGSSSHPTGTGLGVLLFGPWVMPILGTIVLIFQAVLLAHGGLTTLGANTFSMAIVGPLAGSLVYTLARKARVPLIPAVFICAVTADLLTYVVTAGQLALAFPSPDGGVMESFLRFAGIYAVTQVPISVVEGMLTVLIVRTLLQQSSAIRGTRLAAATGAA